MSPNHRAVDIVVSTHSTHLPNLQAKFFYGPLNMAALSGEMVSPIYIGLYSCICLLPFPFSPFSFSYLV